MNAKDSRALNAQKRLIDGVLMALALFAAVIALSSLGGCAAIEESMRKEQARLDAMSPSERMAEQSLRLQRSQMLFNMGQYWSNQAQPQYVPPQSIQCTSHNSGAFTHTNCH